MNKIQVLSIPVKITGQHGIWEEKIQYSIDTR